MSLKQSCYKAALKSDFKRMWWVGVLSTVFMFMITVSNFVRYNNRVYYGYGWDLTKDSTINTLSSLLIVGVPIALILGQVLFSYLNKSSSVTFIHSLPGTRTELFLAHTTFAIITIIGPAILSYLVCFSVVDAGVEPLWLFESLWYYCVYTLLIYSVSSVVAMLCGSTIAGGVFTLVVLYFPLFIFGFFESICEEYLYGYTNRYNYDFSDHWLGDFVYLDFEKLATWRVLIYVVLIVGFIVASLLLYNKRHLENHGEVIAFTSLNGFFKIIFGLCVGILVYFYVGAFHSDVNLLYFCIFSPIGAIAANMLINKGFTFKGAVVPVTVSLAVSLLVFFAFIFDITGFETKIPAIEDIESITFEEGYDRWYYMENEDGDYEEVKLPKPVCKDKKLIDAVNEFHSELVNNRKSINRNEAYYSVLIEYNLKDGKSLLRRYDVNLLQYNKLQQIWFDTNAARNWYYPIFDEDAVFKYNYVSIYDYKIHTDLFNRSDKQFIDDLLSAIKKDKENVTYAQFKSMQSGNRDFDIDIDCQRVYIINGKKYFDDMTLTFMITKNDVNTMNFLIENGLEEAKLAAGNKPLEQVEKFKMLDEDIEIYD